MRIAIVGTGISGLVAAHLLHARHDVTLYEAAGHVGGHAHTVEMELDGGPVAVDTGFIVFNERNYPIFSALLAELGVATQVSDMSFSVSHTTRDFEYRPTTVNSLYACRSNLLRPSFHRMLIDVARFNRTARRALEGPCEARTLGELLAAGRFSPRLANEFVVPLASAIWSADPTRLLDMPVATYVRFMANHGLLAFGDQPTWRTVTGGSARYVEAITRPFGDRIRLRSPVGTVVRRTDGVEVRTGAHGTEHFDTLVLATHSDEALALLGDPTPDEVAVLGPLRYQSNVATLHTDRSLLPRRRRAWASWNYHLHDEPRGCATLSYHMNRLQALDCAEEVLVTLNRADEIDPGRVHASFTYDHPVLDAKAVRAQARRHEIQGRNRTYFCGAYWGFGFHEDGARSAYEACALLDPGAAERVAISTATTSAATTSAAAV